NASGDYSLRTFLAGDANQDGNVDGLDSALVAHLLGSHLGDANFNSAADANRDDVIDAADVRLVAANFGFRSNSAPAVSSSSAFTHVDLPVSVALDSLGEDIDGDAFYFQIVSSVGGVAMLDPSGRSATFVPAPGFSGDASFQVVADDGAATSAVASIVVHVSASPLLNIDFRIRSPRLMLPEINLDRTSSGDIPADPLGAPSVGAESFGGSDEHKFQLEVVGDFADQSDVVLPAGYVSFESLEPRIAMVSAQGLIRAQSNGATAVVARRNDVVAATAVTVGIPTSVLPQMLYARGLYAYPASLSLDVAGGTRQFHVYPKLDSQFEVELTDGDFGTLYFVSRGGVVDVTTDGLASAVGEGTVNVTIIHGPAETIVPVRVIPSSPTGPAVLGEDGGVVKSSDGLAVSVPPGVLEEGTTVSISRASEADLPQAVPDGFHFAAAFNLDVGEKPLDTPVQLAIPVDASIAPGTEVYFFQAGDYLHDDGAVSPIWWQVESGVVGADGVARTSSPPYPGVNGKSLYMVGYPDAHVVRVQVAQQMIANALFSIALTSLTGITVGAMAISSVAGIAATLAVPSAPHPTPFALQVIPAAGLPTTTITNFQVDPGKVNKFTTNITPPPNLLPESPHITSAEVALVDDPATGDLRRELVLKGTNFIKSGQDVSDLQVLFSISGKSGVTTNVAPLPTSTPTELHIEAPDFFALGLAKISVMRPDKVPTLINGHVSMQTVPYYSNTAQINPEGNYVFVALPEAQWTASGVKGELAVLDGDPNHRYAAGYEGDPAFPGTLGQLVARIPLQTPEEYPLPRDVVYYDAPGEIVLRLGIPPEGHRYVRVAADILLIAVGTGLVVDAIEDLNRM
ncbi:MAG TPA: Ig-like domain-containing protein, partial [Pirellulaceae bacterium]|nr:Ig-like domain-containing protein [Pirellulaceae bacterium]